ncbi:tetratricopeptide repeat protein [Caenimonas sedimenti]|uniref:Tetratricopeptide repeat protein n=1 Tax=Caenimonas sedimenti TaxID=2596921 RepID=A0A562ZEM6_9BURK|nr:tetratricopeptide repeat protein [Caenimonas sedimenti]TWO65498.1 tetratricopeptide repeat protein [Caenimonas sedimenti]
MHDLSSPRNGRILTFYSYKGGTGRSMALANVAWILACSGHRVLVIDWDLEAPGLHRYFAPFLIDKEVSGSSGLIDMLDEYASAAILPKPKDGAEPDAAWYRPYADISDHVLSVNFSHFPGGGSIDFLSAGCQDDTYAIKVSSFNWQNFYDRLGGGGFMEALKENARAAYDYVLIDSRTGVSDTAGICTVQMPDTLVVCFTYNNQGIKGAAGIARSAVKQRHRMDDERRELLRQDKNLVAQLATTPLPYQVFPIPMRVDPGESERLEIRQAFARESFDSLVEHLEPSKVPAYWSSVEVPYTPFYAYEEVLAPFKDNPEDPRSVLASFLRITRYLTGGRVGEMRMPLPTAERQKFLDAFAETPQRKRERESTAPVAATLASVPLEQAAVMEAERAMASLDKDEQVIARQVFGRLVRLVHATEGGGCIAIRAALRDFHQSQRSVIAKLASFAVLSISESDDSGTFVLPHPAVVSHWKTLQEWIEKDRDFLLWRQQLRGYMIDWERSGKDDSALLVGTLLSEAGLWATKNSSDLNEGELAYIAASRENATLAAKRPTIWRRAASMGIMTTWTLAIAGGVWFGLAYLLGSPSQNVRLHTQLPVDRVQLGMLRAAAEEGVRTENYTTAIEAYQRMLAISSENDTKVALAYAYRKSGRLGDALVLLNEVAATENSARVQIGIGQTLTSLGRLNEAVVAFSRAIELDTRDADAYYLRGLANVSAGRSGEALADFTRAIEWRPTFAGAYIERANVYENTSKLVEARADYVSVLGIVNASPEDQRFAAERMKVLEPNLRAAGGARRVFIQFQSIGDDKLVEELRRALGQEFKDVAVPPGEMATISTAGDVRFYFPADEKLATAVKESIETFMARKRIRVALKLIKRDIVEKSSPVRAGTVEVWLPPLTGGTQGLIRQSK